MKKLSKDQRIHLFSHADSLKECYDKYEEAVDKLNESIQAARDFRDEVVQEMQDYFDERSEKWHETENGQSYEAWKSEWEGFELEEIDKSEIDGESFGQLPEEPGFC